MGKYFNLNEYSFNPKKATKLLFKETHFCFSRVLLCPHVRETLSQSHQILCNNVLFIGLKFYSLKNKEYIIKLSFHTQKKIFSSTSNNSFHTTPRKPKPIQTTHLFVVFDYWIIFPKIHPHTSLWTLKRREKET